VSWPGGNPLELYPNPVAVDSRLSITQRFAPPVVTSYIERDGQQLPLAGNILRGCPAGDDDTLVVRLDFDDAAMSGTPEILPESIVLATDGHDYVFFDDNSNDTAGTAANGYQVTLRRSQVGGCNLAQSDPLPLVMSYLGVRIGSVADLRVHSNDFTGDGWTNLLDVQLFAGYFGGSPESVDDYLCADLFHDGTVDLSDVVHFAVHYSHASPNAAAGAGPDFVADTRTGVLPATSAAVRSGETGPAKGRGMRRVFPNPFNPSVTIEYALDQPARVSLRIHDLAGRLVATLVDEYQRPRGGNESVVWDGRNRQGRRAASGLYFWRLAIGAEVETGRMMLIE
jgi:hypothetical protein